MSDSELLYHYTSAETLIKIIEGQKLRATCLAYMNDTGEVDYGIGVIMDWCEKRKENAAKEDKRACELITSEMHLELKYHLYAACFSKEGDQLGQWRGYGANGLGVSIGFQSVETLHKSLMTQTAPLLRLSSWLTPVEYDMSAYMIGFEESVFKFVKSVLEFGQEEIPGFYYVLGKLKNPVFKEEQEYRIFFHDEDQPNEKYKTYFSRNGYIIPCYDVPTKKDTLLPIRQIIVGLAVQDFEKAKHSLKSLLESKKYSVVEKYSESYPPNEVVITKSAIPYLP